VNVLSFAVQRLMILDPSTRKIYFNCVSSEISPSGGHMQFEQNGFSMAKAGFFGRLSP